MVGINVTHILRSKKILEELKEKEQKEKFLVGMVHWQSFWSTFEPYQQMLNIVSSLFSLIKSRKNLLKKLFPLKKI